MVNYFSASGKTSYWFCRKCYEEKISKERFSVGVCEIFGLKTPGPIIWKQRRILQETYGYTDDTIIDCLHYVYDIKKIKKISETLYFVQPHLVEEMKQWKRAQQASASSVAAAIAQTKVNEHIVIINEKKKERKVTNLEDGLFDD